MKTALIIVEPPDQDAAQRNWQCFLKNVQNDSKPPKDTERIAENVWQIPLENGLPFLGRLFQLAEEYKIPMRALILDEPPAWIKHPPATQ